MENWNAKIHILPANSGDCFLIELNNSECILIDTGFQETYDKYLKPLLINLKNKGKKISLLIITHIDKDHIGGAKKFIKENGNYNNPQIIKVENIWFNGFRGIIFQKKMSEKINQKQIKKMKIIQARNEMMYLNESNNEISANDLKTFESICNELGYKINNQFSDGIVKQNKNIKIGETFIDVLSPNTQKINKFSKYLEEQLLILFGTEYQVGKSEEFLNFLESLAINEDDIIQRHEIISAKNEKDISDWLKFQEPTKKYSISNDVSIVVLIKYRKIKLLFAGDCYVDTLNFDKEKLNVDILKISHHGSYWNNCGIINKVIAKNYIISTNGKKYGHPSKKILAQIIIDNNANKKIFSNYKIDKIDLLENEEQKIKYNYDYIISNELLI